jgi:hypothetical protein
MSKTVLGSRLVTRTLIVVGVLGLVFAAQTERAVKTAYNAQWQARGTELRLPTRTWEVLFVVVGFLSILALIAAPLLWRRRERRAQHPAVQDGELGWTSVFLSVVAIGFACAAAYGRLEAVEGDGSGNLTIASLCNLASLGVVAALALVIGNLLCFTEGGITRVFRGVFRRQRMNILIVLLLTVALLFIGDTSGQSVDSIRSWSPYVVGSDDPQSGAGAARLTLGLAAALLFALALYESGERLTYSKAAMATARRGVLAVVAGVVTALGAVVFFATEDFGPGLLIAGLILLLVVALDLPDLDVSDLEQPSGVMDAERSAPEWIAITPLLALAAVSVTATVEATLSAGWADWNARLTLLPAVVLGLLAILLTRRRPQRPYGVSGLWCFALVLLLIGLSLAVLGVALWLDSVSEWVMAAYGAFWFVALTGYAVWLFHLDREGHTITVERVESSSATTPRSTHAEPDVAEVDLPAPSEPPDGAAAVWLQRVRGYSIPIVLGPVALSAGVAVFIAVHAKPLDAGQLLGVFSLALVALAFTVPLLHLAVRASLRLRPPRLLCWFGFKQLPVLTLLLLWWVAVGVVQTHVGQTASLHDARLVDRKADDLSRAAVGNRASDLKQYFREWVAAQDDVKGTAADGPVPLVLVAAHGGGIRAAYWTALALDCIVGYTADHSVPATLASLDAAAAQKIRDQTCSSHRRSAEEQQTAAKRIFMASGVSGGAVGLYAYARQLLHNGGLGPKGGARENDWVDRRLGGDFASPAIGWALYHDVPNRLFGLHPSIGAPCGWKTFGVCLTQDRAAVLEDTFDAEWDDPASSLAQLRRVYDLRFATDAITRRNARLVPLLAMNATLTGGKARAVISAADLGSWPRADADSPERGDDRFPLAGTVEIRDALCETQDMRLSTAAFLAARFPYVAPSGRVPGRCGYDGELRAADTPADVLCAHPNANVHCQGHYVDGGYIDNSGLATLVAIWPSLRALIVRYNLDANKKHLRPIAPMIVELDNHYQKSLQASVPSGGSAAETLVPPLTAFGGRSSVQTYARAAAYRVLPESCTVTISPALHPGLIAPLGWELSEAARTDLRAGLTNPHPADSTGKAVENIRALQFRLAATKNPTQTIGPPLSRCIPAPP